MNPEILDACQQAETDFQSAVSNPIWQLLFLENTAFTEELPPEFKLLLLKAIFLKWNQLSVPDEAFLDDGGVEDRGLLELNSALERLREIEVDIDPWETEWPGVSYSDEDTELERSFEIGNGWSVNIRFADCDIEMKDVNYGCDERLSLGQWLEAFFGNPSADIRAVAEACDLSYEPAMSPEDGFYFRFCGLLLTHTSGDWFELEAHELGKVFKMDQKLVQQLEHGMGWLPSEALKSIRTANSGLRPIFDAPPDVDEETSGYSEAYEWHSPEGVISLSWKCNCWLPAEPRDDWTAEQPPSSSSHYFSKQTIHIAFEAHGNSEGSAEIIYSRHRVEEARDEILKQLNDDRLQPLYLYALGLPLTRSN
jgi:hypothetical protein